MQNETINLSVIEELKACSGGDAPNFFKEVLSTYILETEERLQALRNAFHSADAGLVGKLAHSMNGTSQNVGAEIFARQMQEFERKGYKSVLPNAIQLKVAETEFIKVKAALSALIA